VVQNHGFGVEEECTWSPNEVRFVLWYHLTTRLSNVAIATIFNVTYDVGDGKVPEMQSGNVQLIIETVESRMEAIELEIARRQLGKWPRPTEQGWSLCDHDMVCATMAEVSDRKSVMRVAGLKTRRARERATMATGLWEGDWEETVQCPRKHKQTVPATMNPIYQPPTDDAAQRSPRCFPGKQVNAKAVAVGEDSKSTLLSKSVASERGQTPFTLRVREHAVKSHWYISRPIRGDHRRRSRTPLANPCKGAF
jgi:hypothetical protein